MAELITCFVCLYIHTYIFIFIPQKTKHMHVQKSILNFAKWNQIVLIITLLRLIWHQMEFCLVQKSIRKVELQLKFV